MPFLEWFAEADNRAELEEIRRHLRCSPAEAAILLMLGQLTEAVGTEVQFLEIEDGALFCGACHFYTLARR